MLNYQKQTWSVCILSFIHMNFPNLSKSSCRIYLTSFEFREFLMICQKIFCSLFQYTRYFIFQIRAPGGHDTTFIISTYTINKVKYNNYFITINHVCHRLEQREVIQARLSKNFIFSLSI
jgi:hypothetical protein